MPYQHLFEEAWERRCKEATGNPMDEKFEGGWSAMRDDAETICREIKRKFWGQPGNGCYGVHYDDVADILFDIHQVIRHQLWLDNPNPDKPRFIVSADPAHQFGSEPLATIKSEEYETIQKDSQAAL